MGPSSWTEEMIPKMIASGVNIFRLNCSHRRGGDFERVYPLIRKTAADMGVKVEILGDLQGPKFRVGELAGDPITVGEYCYTPMLQRCFRWPTSLCELHVPDVVLECVRTYFLYVHCHTIFN